MVYFNAISRYHELSRYRIILEITADLHVPHAVYLLDHIYRKHGNLFFIRKELKPFISGTKMRIAKCFLNIKDKFSTKPEENCLISSEKTVASTVFDNG